MLIFLSHVVSVECGERWSKGQNVSLGEKTNLMPTLFIFTARFHLDIELDGIAASLWKLFTNWIYDISTDRGKLDSRRVWSYIHIYIGNACQYTRYVLSCDFLHTVLTHGYRPNRNFSAMRRPARVPLLSIHPLEKVSPLSLATPAVNTPMHCLFTLNKSPLELYT